jgi:hypothetical protein
LPATYPGILGLVYQYKKNKRDALITGMLFFFTGFAIVLYLNQAGNHPVKGITLM